MARKPAPPRKLGRLLDASGTPLYLCDGDGRFAYGNAAFETWLGVAAGDLEGLSLRYSAAVSAGAVLELTTSLAPPPEVYAGQRCVALLVAPGSGGATTRRRVEFLPLLDETGRFAVLAVVAASEATAEQCPAEPHSSPELHTALADLRRQLGAKHTLAQLVGQSQALKQVREQVQLAAQSGVRTLIVGPPGSGREHVARTIHQLRGGGSLVPIQGQAINAEQLQAAVVALLKRQQSAPQPGRPTLLILDADQLAPAAQLELSGLLLLPGVELATLATARRSLHRLAETGRFRQDLAFALSTLTVRLPRLSRRPEDIPLLAQFFLEQANAQGERQLSGFAPEALDELAGYEWPGNVDELAGIVAAACKQAGGLSVAASDLPPIIRIAAVAVAHPRKPPEKIRLDAVLEDVEKELLTRALAQAKGNKTTAAELLGVSRQRLLRRLVQLGLAAPAAEVVFEPVEDEEQAAP